MMYTEEQLLQAIKYACEYQKATDYQTAVKLLIGGKEDTPQNYLIVLDKLSNEEIAFSEIDLKDIFDE